jgi:hypothetical protein
MRPRAKTLLTKLFVNLFATFMTANIEQVNNLESSWCITPDNSEVTCHARAKKTLTFYQDFMRFKFWCSWVISE